MIVAGHGHAGAMAAIHETAFAPADRWKAAAMAELLASPGVFALIHPAGGCVMARVVSGEAEILTLAVAPEQRRRGIGRGLLGLAMEQAADRAAEIVFLEVSPANAAAVSLYEAAGFSAVGRRVGYYPNGSDALVLRKALTSV